MNEYEQLRRELADSFSWPKFRLAMRAFLLAFPVDMAKLRRFCQLHVDLMLAEKLPLMEMPSYLKPFRKYLEPWIREIAAKFVGEFVDVYFSAKPMVKR